MIGVIWFLLIVVLVIAQLSQTRSKTTLKGRPFEAPPANRRSTEARREVISRPSSMAEKKQKEDPFRDAFPRQATAARVEISAPEAPQTVPPQEEATAGTQLDLRSAIVWAEVIGPPVARRKGRV